MTSEELAIAIERDQSGARVLLSGALAITTTDQLLEHFSDESLTDAELVVIDLTGVSFMDSTGLHSLLRAYEHFGERLRIISTRALEPLFEHSGARRFLPFTE